MSIRNDTKISPMEMMSSKSSRLPRPPLNSTVSFWSIKEDKPDTDEEAIDSPNIDAKISDVIENYRLTVKKFLSAHWIGQTYNYTLLILSVLSSLQYIYQLYLDPSKPHDLVQIAIFPLAEEVLACLFMFDWCLSFFIADHKINHIMSFFSMVDLLTVIPIWITRNTPQVYYSQIVSFTDFLVFLVYGLTTTRILRALRLRQKLIQAIEDDVQRCLGEMTLAITIMILFNSALMQYLEQEEQDYPFHTWTYYMLVTVATVGYGDISPKTDLGRGAAMAMIAFAIVTIPKMSNELIAAMSRQSIYARIHYTPKSKRSAHVIICGDLKSTSITEFFNEIFHEDHQSDNLHAVIIQPDQPSKEILDILRDPLRSLVVTYLEGSALSDRDLKRAKADSSLAIFIMTNKFSTNPDEEDAKSILQQFSIKRYIASKNASALNLGKNDTLFCMQLIRPENKRHLAISSSADSENKELVLCLNEIKMGIISKAVVCPGITTLLMNLMSSFADDETSTKEDPNAEIENLDDDEVGNWMGEYQRGCDWEIYTTELSEIFCGAKFASISEVIYQKLGVVLFAIEIEDKRNEKSTKKLLLNPGDFIIPPKSQFNIEAFVIAPDKSQSDLTFTSGLEESSNHKLKLAQISTLAMSLTGSNGPEQHSQHVVALANEISISSEMQGSDTEEHKNGTSNGNNGGRFAWQNLLRERNNFGKSREGDRFFQEKQQQMEDAYARSAYYMRSHPVELFEATVKTSVIDEIPNIENHLIIIGKSVNNLYDLIRPLRAKYLGSMKYIVILYPDDIPHAAWRRISMFEGILVVRGSGLEEADIRRAGIYRATEVVVLADTVSDRSSNSSNQGSENDALIDADAIFTYQCIRKMNENAHVVVEIVRQSNVSYLDPEIALSSTDLDYKFTPQFASGVLFTSSLLDTLAGQAFYNPKIIRLLNELVSGLDSKDAKDLRAKQRGLHAIAKSSLYQINVPEVMESRTYGALYTTLAKKHMIPLGIFRGVYSHLKMGPKSNKACYVFTNPPRDTELFSCDKVFVLSQLPPQNQSRVHIRDQSTKESIFYDNIRRRRNLAEDTANSIGILRDDVALMMQNQQAFEAKLTEDMNDRFIKLTSSIEAFKQQSSDLNDLKRAVNGNGNAGNRDAAYSTASNKGLVLYPESPYSGLINGSRSSSPVPMKSSRPYTPSPGH